MTTDATAVTLSTSGSGMVLQVRDGNMILWTWASHIDGPDPDVPPEIGAILARHIRDLLVPVDPEPEDDDFIQPEPLPGPLRPLMSAPEPNDDDPDTWNANRIVAEGGLPRQEGT